MSQQTSPGDKLKSGEGSPEVLDSGRGEGGKGPSRMHRPGAVSGYSSYAALGLLKENMLASKAKPAAEQKGPSPRSSAVAQGEEQIKTSPGRAERQLLKRTPPSKEVALMNAELELLQRQNQELMNKLQAAEAKLGQHHRAVSDQHQGVQNELDFLKRALTSADEEKAGAMSAAESAVGQLERIRQNLQDLLLMPPEVEEAALKCCWVAHYWGLACKYQLYPDVAASRAAYWQALAAPASAMAASARHLHSLLQGNAPDEEASSSSSSSRAAGGSRCASRRYTQPEWMQSRSGHFSTCMQASAADVMEVERGMRQLQELGVEVAALAAMSDSARLAAAAGPLELPSSLAACGEGWRPPGMSEDEADEIGFQCSWLAYLWGRAALAGVEQQVAQERADYWVWRLSQPRSTRDFGDLRQGLQELRLLGVEQQLWQCRRGRPAAAGAAGPAAGEAAS